MLRRAVERCLEIIGEAAKSVSPSLADAGVHPTVVQEQLGHSAIAVTLDTYSHVPQAVRRDGADKIAALFGD